MRGFKLNNRGMHSALKFFASPRAPGKTGTGRELISMATPRKGRVQSLKRIGHVSYALALRRGSDGAELVKKDLAAAASAAPRLVAEGEKSVPLAPSLSKPGGVFLHCIPSSAIAGARSRSAAVALVATGDGSHGYFHLYWREDHSGNRTATYQPLTCWM